MLALAPALALGAVACVVELSPGSFEEGGDSEAPSSKPPDLPSSECDPRRLDDCEEGFKCSYVDDADGPSNRCVELLGAGLAGEDCELLGDSDTCANHHVCWGADAEGLGGRCVSFCSTALQCETAEELCAVSNYDLLFLCLQRCDPLLQDCEPGWGCYPDANERWSCDRDRSDESGAHAEPCSCLNCCDPGLICMPGTLIDGELCGSVVEEDIVPAEGCCAAVCDAEDELTPAEEQCPTEAERCREYYSPDAVVMGFEHVGVCRL